MDTCESLNSCFSLTQPDAREVTSHQSESPGRRGPDVVREKGSPAPRRSEGVTRPLPLPLSSPPGIAPRVPPVASVLTPETVAFSVPQAVGCDHELGRRWGMFLKPPPELEPSSVSLALRLAQVPLVLPAPNQIVLGGGVLGDACEKPGRMAGLGEGGRSVPAQSPPPALWPRPAPISGSVLQGV